MAAAKLGSDCVPQQLHEFDAVLSLVAIGSAHVLVHIRTNILILEIQRVRVEIDQP
ncbi:hypothetical protein D3C83_140370 [compost metagenome]